MGNGRTTMDDAMDIIKICQSFQHGQGNLAHDVYIYRANFLVDTVQRALIHEFHADTDIWIGDECTVEGDDVLRVTVMHDL